MKKTIYFLLLLLTMHFLQGGSAPAFDKTAKKESAKSEKPPAKKAPRAPDFDATGPNFLIGVGLAIAGIGLVSPWLAIGIGLGILVLALILVLLIDPDSLKPKGRGVVGKFIAIIFGIIIGFLLLMLLIFALLLGLAFLIGGLIGAATSPAVGGLVIAGIGVLWLLISLLVNWIRRIRYNRYKRADQKQE